MTPTPPPANVHVRNGFRYVTVSYGPQYHFQVIRRPEAAPSHGHQKFRTTMDKKSKQNPALLQSHNSQTTAGVIHPKRCVFQRTLGDLFH